MPPRRTTTLPTAYCSTRSSCEGGSKLIEIIVAILGILTLVLLSATIAAYRKGERGAGRESVGTVTKMAVLTMIACGLLFAGFATLVPPETGLLFAAFGIGELGIVMVYIVLKSSRPMNVEGQKKPSRTSWQIALIAGMILMASGAVLYLVAGMPEISSALTGVGLLISVVSVLSLRP